MRKKRTRPEHQTFFERIKKPSKPPPMSLYIPSVKTVPGEVPLEKGKLFKEAFSLAERPEKGGFPGPGAPMKPF